MQKYELVYIVPPDFPEKDLLSLAHQIDDVIKKTGGMTLKNEQGGKRKLGYSIKQAQYGYYGVIHLELPSEKITELEKQLRLNASLCRFMMTKIMPPMHKKKSRRRPVKESVTDKITARLSSVPERKSEMTPLKIKKDSTKKVSLEELDEKLDELLKDDIVK